MQYSTLSSPLSLNLNGTEFTIQVHITGHAQMFPSYSLLRLAQGFCQQATSTSPLR